MGGSVLLWGALFCYDLEENLFHKMIEYVSNKVAWSLGNKKVIIGNIIQH